VHRGIHRGGGGGGAGLYTRRAAQQENIESSPILDTSCGTELIYDLIDRQLLYVKCPKPVTIQYLRPADSTRRRMMAFDIKRFLYISRS